MRSILRSTVLALMAVLAVAACDDDPAEPDTTLLEAVLEGIEPYEDVEGDVDIESRSNSFTAEISIAGANEGDEFDWTVARGTCAQPGNAVGQAASYPALQVDEEGTASAEATVNVALDEDEDYIVRVIDNSGQEPAPVACGEVGPRMAQN